MASYLQVEELSKSYGEKTLFDHISFNINEGDKIALIAPNGTGKTSLLKILAGKDTSDGGGKVKFMKDIHTFFVEQNTVLDGDLCVLDALMKKVKDTGDTKAEWDLEIQAKQHLTALGITDFNRKASLLSGGEAKRVDIAAVMIADADFLVMDEPTNHLDLEAIEYLEEYLKKSRMTLFMVTHDRYFLDRVCNVIFELDKGNLYIYKGNYQYYLEKREERIDIARRESDKWRNIYRRELEWMRSTPCARTGKARYRINAFYDIQDRSAKIRADKEVSINMGASRIGSKVINCRNLAFGYGESQMLSNFTYNFSAGEKVGIVGRNGIGKSTFLDLLCGRLQPTSGEIDTGVTVKIGYYRQEGIEFKSGQTVLETVREIAETALATDGTHISVTTFLQQFLFPVEMFNTKVELLSGGERRRLYLLTVLMRQPNLLLLDEPTNDLDIITLNVLENYIKDYKGSVIIVSHDRYFLDKTVDHMFVFTGNGHVKDFVGTYSEYREYMKDLEKNNIGAKEGVAKGKKVYVAQPQDESKLVKRKLSFKEQRELEELERDIDSLYKERKQIEEALSNGSLSHDELTLKSCRISEIINLLDEKEMRWIELSE